jgi:hypothetical protein
MNWSETLERRTNSLLLKEGCRKAAGWCSRTRSHLIEVAKRTELKKERFASIKGCFALLADHPGADAPPFLQKEGSLYRRRLCNSFTLSNAPGEKAFLIFVRLPKQ